MSGVLFKIKKAPLASRGVGNKALAAAYRGAKDEWQGVGAIDGRL